MSFRTPFDEDGRINFKGVRKTIARSIEDGSRTAMLTTGDRHFTILPDNQTANPTRFTCEHTD